MSGGTSSTVFSAWGKTSAGGPRYVHVRTFIMKVLSSEPAVIRVQTTVQGAGIRFKLCFSLNKNQP